MNVVGREIEHVSEFKYLRFVFNESGTNSAECCKEVESEKKITGDYDFNVQRYCRRACLCLFNAYK